MIYIYWRSLPALLYTGQVAVCYQIIFSEVSLYVFFSRLTRLVFSEDKSGGFSYELTDFEKTISTIRFEQSFSSCS